MVINKWWLIGNVGVCLVVLLVVLAGNVLVFTGRAVSSSNVEVEIPLEYQQVFAGEKVWFTTRIINLANDQRVDVVLKYSLLDESSRVVVTRSETVAIETQASFVGSLMVPSGVLGGEYVLVVEVMSKNGHVAVGSVPVRVVLGAVNNNFLEENSAEILVGLSILMVLLVVWRLRGVLLLLRQRWLLKSRIRNIIFEKIRLQKINADELKNSCLPTLRKSSRSVNDKIF